MATSYNKNAKYAAQQAAGYASDEDLKPYMDSLTDADKGLSAEAQKYIAQQKYNYANAKTDEERNSAHKKAEGVRYEEGGYYAGKSGTDHITRDDVYVSSADQKHMNMDQLNDTLRNKMMVKAGLLSTEEANALAQGVREQYGYSGGQYGNRYDRLRNADGSYQFLYDGMPGSISQYQQMIQNLANGLVNRGSFSYNPENDPLYQNYAQQYTAGAQSAMQNTLAQISARTGGLASSYAGQAAQQSYNGYMSQLANKIPELQQLAYQMYRDEADDTRNNISMLMGLANNDYDLYANERNFNYNNYLSNRDYNYQYNRDKNADYQYETEMNQRALEFAADALQSGTKIWADAAADGVDANTYYAQWLPYLAGMIENRYWPGTL